MSFAVTAMFTSGLLSTAPNAFVAAASGPQPAVLVNALNGLRADGWHAVEAVSAQTPAAVPASVPAPASGTLTETQLQALVRLANTKGQRGKLNQLVTNALGLTSGTDPIAPLQYTMHDPKGFGHAFCVLDGGSGYILGIAYPGRAEIYYVGLDLSLKAALNKRKDENPESIATGDAQKNLSAEFAYLALIADQGSVASNL
jgi:hypothetical protein